MGFCSVCTFVDDEMIGNDLSNTKNNPTEIYDKEWSYVRFLSVDPAFGGNGIGRQLTSFKLVKKWKDKWVNDISYIS